VETDDGYILTLHRIARPGATPVLLVHGLLDSSATWVMMGPNKGLGKIIGYLLTAHTDCVVLFQRLPALRSGIRCLDGQCSGQYVFAEAREIQHTPCQVLGFYIPRDGKA